MKLCAQIYFMEWTTPQYVPLTLKLSKYFTKFDYLSSSPPEMRSIFHAPAEIFWFCLQTKHNETTTLSKHETSDLFNTTPVCIQLLLYYTRSLWFLPSTDNRKAPPNLAAYRDFQFMLCAHAHRLSTFMFHFLLWCVYV